MGGETLGLRDSIYMGRIGGIYTVKSAAAQRGCKEPR